MPTETNQGMVHYYNHVLRNYATFKGRARRQEYWKFYFFNMLLTFGLIIGGAVTGATFVNTIYSLATLIPSLAVATRRLHDVGKSGWYLIVPIYNLILLVRQALSVSFLVTAGGAASGDDIHIL